jgi:sirohydrochlorin ferrochelatase
MVRRVWLQTGDLVFRAKLRAVVEGAGGELAGAEAAELAVVEVGSPQWETRVVELVGRGVPVLAFGPHVRADLLRVARERGAVAVPNSQVEEALHAFFRHQ